MTAIEKVIVKYYNPKRKNYNPHNWEKCGNEIYNLIRQKEDEIRSKNLWYAEECKKLDEVRNRLENEYNSYFGLKNINGIIAGYDWINGNDKLKNLISLL
jgi:hypothetical protein